MNLNPSPPPLMEREVRKDLIAKQKSKNNRLLISPAYAALISNPHAAKIHKFLAKQKRVTFKIALFKNSIYLFFTFYRIQRIPYSSHFS